LLAGKLTGRRVLIVSMPKSDGLVADLKSMLALSRAKVTGAIEINDKFVDTTENATLIDLAEKSLTTAAIDGLPANSDGVETSSALLGAVLLDNDQQITQNARQQVLSAYDGYISGYKDITGPAETVVFLAPPPYTDNNATGENKNVETIVDRFSQVPAPVVVASAGASGSGNVIGAVTGDATLNTTVSTVDNVDTPEGQVTTVLAVEERLVRGKTGHYGLSSSSTSLLPKRPED
jgi:Copper transport outer membrane protein, MctB